MVTTYHNIKYCSESYDVEPVLLWGDLYMLFDSIPTSIIADTLHTTGLSHHRQGTYKLLALSVFDHVGQLGAAQKESS